MEKTQVQRVSVKTQEIDLKKSKGRRNNRSEKTHLNSEILVRLVMVLKFGSVKHLDLSSSDFAFRNHMYRLKKKKKNYSREKLISYSRS